MMQRIKELFGRYREQILYLFFGGCTTLIDWVISFALYRFWIDATAAPDFFVHIADGIAWVVAVLFAFITNRIWVFESKKTETNEILGELAAFSGGRVFTFLLQEGIMLLFVTVLSLNKYLFRLITAVLVIILNYIISKLMVFRK